VALEVSFEAELWLHAGEGGWYFVTLPPDVSDEIREQAPRGPGFGSVKVSATVGATRWETSVFPESKSGSYVLPVKQRVRRENGLVAGDTVAVRLSVATA
jgi:hypothetical protein